MTTTLKLLLGASLLLGCSQTSAGLPGSDTSTPLPDAGEDTLPLPDTAPAPDMPPAVDTHAPEPDTSPPADVLARDLPSSAPPCTLDVDCRGVTDHNGNSTHCFLRLCGPQSTGDAGYCTSTPSACTTTGQSCFPNQLGQRCVWTGSEYQCLALLPGNGYCPAGTKPKIVCSQEFCAPT